MGKETALGVLLLVPVLFGCGRRAPEPPAGQVRRGYSELGLASHYADRFAGRRTASGEVYTHRKLTAAHRTLPFGTRVRVTNLENHRSILLRVNDRGPFVPGRIIDLSAGAARKLGFYKKGTARVRVETVEVPG